MLPCLEKMTACLARRGPDDQRCWLDADINFGLGHRRLSIIDLSKAAAQPMHSDDSGLVMTFNGEIYNYIELREELEKVGVEFNTSSDSEVLLAAIATWGIEKALKKARGMLALAVFDRNKKRLYLARDRFGEKPLYVYHRRDCLAFSSDLESFKHLKDVKLRLDMRAVAGFLKYNFVPGGHSIYQDIFQVKPGTILSFSCSSDEVSQVGSKEYWQIGADENVAPFVGSFADAVEQLKDLLGQVIKEQRRSDVEIGCFLSSGIDSSLLSRLLQQQGFDRLKTFNVGFADEEFDESEGAAFYARKIGADHQQIIFSDDDVARLLPDCVAAFSEPFADTSQLPMLLLCREARKKVKVCLSGDGADEVFAGYVRHLQVPWFQKAAKILPQKLFGLAGRVAGNISLRRLRAIEKLAAGFPLPIRLPRHLAVKVHKFAWMARSIDNFHDSLLAEWQKDALPLSEQPYLPEFFDRQASGLRGLQQNDISAYLRDDVLVKTDRAAMYHGLETRLPYLDPRLWEFVCSLPEDFLIGGGQGKRLLQALHNRLLPEYRSGRGKTGFSPSLRRLLCGRLRHWVAERLNDPILMRVGLDARVITKKWQEFVEGRYDWTFSIWALVMLAEWLRKNVR